MKKIFFVLLTLTFGIYISGKDLVSKKDYSQNSANVSGYDTSRIYKAMAKARAGGEVNIVVFGGSITAGSLATTESKRWANLVKQWWSTTFPGATINLINSGIGGTGSDVGAFRVKEDVLGYGPDFVVVEFSVNDAGKEPAYVQEMMEGVIRGLLQDTSKTGIMMLLLKMENGGTAQADHKIVGNHYNIPMISYADLIDQAATDDGLTLSQVFGDSPNGVHPNDKGMQYIADFIIAELDTIYSNLPDDNNLPLIDTVIPAPVVNNTYQNTYKYTSQTLAPLSNSGWTTSGGGWISGTPGSEISFELEGNAIGVQFRRHNVSTWGRVEVWIDNNTHQTLDAYWAQTWGPATIFSIIEDGLSDGLHILHIKALEETSTSGNYFNVLNVLKAGNLTNIAPIARSNGSRKIVLGSTVQLEGANSYDIEGDLLTYSWNLISKPAGSSVSVVNSASASASVTPDVKGKYKIEFKVNDGKDNSVPIIHYINVVESNSAPVANAGNDTTIGSQTKAYLNGKNSYDQDNDSLLYYWNVISQPATSNVTISQNPLSKELSVYISKEGEYLFTLTVNDSIQESAPDTMKITSIEGYYVDMKKNSVKQLNIFPNPANGIVNIDGLKNISDNINIKIYSFDGKLTYSHSILISGQNTISINLPEIESGIYLLHLQCDDFISIEKIRIIK